MRFQKAYSSLHLAFLVEAESRRVFFQGGDVYAEFAFEFPHYGARALPHREATADVGVGEAGIVHQIAGNGAIHGFCGLLLGVAVLDQALHELEPRAIALRAQLHHAVEGGLRGVLFRAVGRAASAAAGACLVRLERCHGIAERGATRPGSREGFAVGDHIAALSQCYLRLPGLGAGDTSEPSSKGSSTGMPYCSRTFPSSSSRRSGLSFRVFLAASRPCPRRSSP